MENLFKQLRSNNPNPRQAGREDRTIPPQKTESFKGEKKRTPSWIKRQFSMSRENNDSTDEAEYQLAVAAAALAIKSLDESGTRVERRGSRVPDVAYTRTKSRLEAIPAAAAATPPPPPPPPPPQRRAKSIKFSDEAEKPLPDGPDQRVHITTEGTEKRPMKKKISFADTHMNSSGSLLPEGRVPPSAIKKTSTFDNIPDRTRIRKPEIEDQTQKITSPVRPPFLPAADNMIHNTKPPGKGAIDAESWERAEFARIREKHEKLNAKILDWEQKKKNKAKRRLDKIEAELDKKRSKAMQNYRSQLVSIENISGGARSQAAENRKKEEFKVKEKAEKMRLTGKLPATCWCF